MSGCGKDNKGLGEGRDIRHHKILHNIIQVGVSIKLLSVYHLDKMLFSNAQ